MSRIKRSFWQYIAEDEELTASEAIGNMKQKENKNGKRTTINAS